MDDWEKLNETLSPEKEDFYSHLNTEDITNADYIHAKRLCKDFNDLYVQSQILMLVDVFNNFQNVWA